MTPITLTKADLAKIKSIRNRELEIVPFDLSRIRIAIMKAFNQTNEGGEKEAEWVAKKVYKELLSEKKASKDAQFLPSVELIQDMVERELMVLGFTETAKSYILYRKQRADVRAEIGEVPEHVRELVEESRQYFRNPLAEFVYYRTYARWIEAEGRRESWIETVDRYIGFMRNHVGKALTEPEYKEIRDAILNQHAMPSMRLMQFAGKPAELTNVCAYNCSFIAPTSFQDLAEIMYISMCGTGAGWSVESPTVEQFPQIGFQTGKKLPTHVVPDSKEGWASALVVGMDAWAAGFDISFDYSEIRPYGARLKTMGGKASGPEPLRKLLSFTRDIMLKRQGKRLRNIDVHDIICMIGDCVVAGGVRRSAMISLSDLDDENIRDAKKGEFWNTAVHRSLANNSAVYMSKPSQTEFLSEWLSLMQSGTGERGIFNRGSLHLSTPERRLKAWGEYKGYFAPDGRVVAPIGTNPCGEIILQSKQFCNLSEVIARSEDTEQTLLKKIRIATILGTFQSTLTKFPYLSKEWKQNCERERLLGVSVTGQWDSKVARDPKILTKLKAEAIRVNKLYAKRFGVNESTAITCVKPSGTVSQTVDSASGMHPRYAKYYIRRVRISANDSLFRMMKDQGVPYYPEVGQDKDNATTYVLEFPVKAPNGAITKDEISALAQLEHWKVVKLNYTEHNPSVTVYVGEEEWITVANWIYENWDIVGGLSFLPRSNHVYQLAPYEEIDAKHYEEINKRMPKIDFSKLVTYEREDETEAKKELACAGGVCEII